MLLITCGGGPTVSAPPPPALSIVVESAHFTFRYAPGDSVDSEKEEAWYTWAVAQLGVSMSQKIQYFKYTSTTHMQQLTGKAANGWADPAAFAVHTIFRWDDHESVHVMTAVVGRPSDFFNEGIAVALSTDPYAPDPTQPIWYGQPVDSFPRNALQQGRLPHVQDICESTSFRALPDSDGYPWAGSFVHFLVQRYGMADMMNFFRAGTSSETRGIIEARFQQVYGIPLLDADLAWRSYLAQ